MKFYQVHVRKIKKYLILVHVTVISIFVFIWLRIHLILPKKNLVILIIFTIAIIYHWLLAVLIPFHIRWPEDCYKLSNLIAYDKMNCLDFLLINQKIRLCDMCSILVTFVMVDQLKRINLIWKLSSATAYLIRHII